MGMVKVTKGKYFIRRNEKMSCLYLVVQGKVQQIYGKDSYVIETGNLVGIAGCNSGVYESDYVALEECVLYTFPYEKPQDFHAIFESQPKYAVAFLQAALRQTIGALDRYMALKKQADVCFSLISGAYKQYCMLCEERGISQKLPYQIESLKKLQLDGMPGEWEVAYLRELAGISSMVLDQFYGKNYTLVIGELVRIAGTMNTVMRQMKQIREYIGLAREVLLRENRGDLFELYTNLAIDAAGKNLNIQEILEVAEKLKEYIQNSGMYHKELVHLRLKEFDGYDFDAICQKAMQEQEMLEMSGEDEDEEDCLAHILTYVEYDEEKIQHVREVLANYRKAEEDFATDDAARRVRREITTIFYDVYKKAFRASLLEEEASPIIQMFLHFGFLDVQTAGEENANDLYELTDKLEMCRGEYVYTMYDWLCAIYSGEQEPSRNEFDLDYNGYLHEQRRMGHITAEEEKKMQTDNWQKVVYEIENMFTSANKATYGKISTFCPVLSSGDIMGSVKNMLVTATKLENAIDTIREIDFSLFYHEVIFSDPAHGVNKEMIQKEILPHIILMPNVGTRAMMWQETAGLKRDTSARFIFPILTSESLEDMMLVVCGRYRWEICRKIQGMRWNDITEKSLTSEYCDYIQFYRKNHDLSVETKDKIKNALMRAKNNYREVFVMDYLSWIRYESSGSFRLNRVARDIIFRYCPFNKEIRNSLGDNPMYQEIFQRYRVYQERKIRHMRAFTDKYLKSGGRINADLQEAIDFLEK